MLFNSKAIDMVIKFLIFVSTYQENIIFPLLCTPFVFKYFFISISNFDEKKIVAEYALLFCSD